MKKAIAIIPIVVALATASPALAGTRHVAPAHHNDYRSEPGPSSHTDSGWGPPSNWNEIEISTPSCC